MFFNHNEGRCSSCYIYVAAATYTKTFLKLFLEIGPRGVECVKTIFEMVDMVRTRLGCVHHPLGPLGSSSSQHRRTPEIVL